MPLELRRNADGSLKSKYWYGSFMIGGKRRVVSLGIKVRGVPPASLRGLTDDQPFETSRLEAKLALDTRIAEEQERHRPEEYIQRLHKLRTGHRITSITLDQMGEAWQNAPRKRRGSDSYTRQALSLFSQFGSFIKGHYHQVETLADVTPEMAEAFLDDVRQTSVSARTWNAKLILLRSSFKVLARKASIAQNPFGDIPTAAEMTVHRRPFSVPELQAVITAAEADHFIGPIVITGICTAMRRGDCCLLKRADVDIPQGFVRVKTSKTGETVEIPLFPMLQRVIEKHGGATSPYFFPEQAEMYRRNPSGITYRVRKLFESAGFFDEEEGDDAAKNDAGRLREVPAESLQREGLAVIDRIPREAIPDARRERMRRVFNLYAEGHGFPYIARHLELGKATLSADLHMIEEHGGIQVVRRPVRERPKQIASIRTERADGIRRASVRDFHSFRVTWITLALSSGMPIELVQRVTGHKTTDVVLKHYFRPGREAFRSAVLKALPDLAAINALPQGETRDESVVPASEIEALLETAIEKLQRVRSRDRKIPEAIDCIRTAQRHMSAQ